MDIIKEKLFSIRNIEYSKFMSNLTPGFDEDYFIGVKTPELRVLAKEIAKEDYCKDFLNELPHQYFEENQIHGFIISGMKDYDMALEELKIFLPYINNWATCDQTSPKVFKKNKDKLLPEIFSWLKSDHIYTVRFGIGMLMQNYLDDSFDPKYVKLVSSIKSDEYYINMEIAWYMATALAKKWDDTIKIVEEKSMDKWVQNKTIQKAVESFRITAEQKVYLRTLKIK